MALVGSLVREWCQMQILSILRIMLGSNIIGFWVSFSLSYLFSNLHFLWVCSADLVGSQRSLLSPTLLPPHPCPPMAWSWHEV